MLRSSIVIPVYNRAGLTKQCLDKLVAAPGLNRDYEVIVVDDGSRDYTPHLLASYGDKIRVITHTTNSSFAVGCNDGATAAEGEFVIFLNNDTLPQAGWLDALVECADENPRAAIVGSKLIFPNGTIQHAGMVICQDKQPRHHYLGMPQDHPAVNYGRRYQIVAAAAMLVRRNLFIASGGFDIAFRNGYEDVDFCLRLGEMGYEVYYCPASRLYHFEGVSEGRFAHEDMNLRLYLSRWSTRVEPDDVTTFLQDKLLGIEYRAHYPLSFHLSPYLGTVNETSREQEMDKLLADRTQQVYDLLKENIALRVKTQELEAAAGKGTRA
ncbi:MAG: glycosyltransferase family 2 protein [Anaerolineae bacterium]|nr:glycosyltransferase family 2 protein [Anaerolineae bacterium]